MMNITISNLYDSDYQLWLESTINQLRRGDFQAVVATRLQSSSMEKRNQKFSPTNCRSFRR